MRRQVVKDTQTAILDRCLRLFADKGYAGTSMRDIAREMDLSVAAVYHHFPSKRDLYGAVASHAFRDKKPALLAAISGHGPAEERLRSLMRRYAELVSDDPVFHRFFQRELLDADEQRLQLLAKNFFYEAYAEIQDLIREVAPSFDPYMFLTSMFAMVMYHYQLGNMHNYLPGVPARVNDPAYVTDHVMRMITEGLGHKQTAANETVNVVSFR